MNSEERLSFLLKRYADNNCSKEEFSELFILISHSGNKQQLLAGLKDAWESTESSDLNSKMQWDALHGRIQYEKSLRKKITSVKLWQKIAAAACLILTCGALLFYLNNSHNNSIVHQKNIIVSNAELAPGGNRAMLTLSNGKKIVLDDKNNGLIAKQNGVSIRKTAHGEIIYTNAEISTSNSATQYNTIETPKGGQYQLTLPDGTKIWLNAMSVLKYPLHFADNNRSVVLTGEGYFEVAKDKSRPFRVHTDKQSVEVLGTHFNLNAYDDEQVTKTTLLEGSVRVRANKTGSSKVLIPGEQSANTGLLISTQSVDPELAVAWKNGNFIFYKDNLENIMKQVSRWYDLDVVYKEESSKKQLFSGSVSKFENASQVLDILQLTGLVHFKVEGRRVTVM